MDLRLCQDSRYVHNTDGELEVKRCEINVIINDGQEDKQQFVLAEYENHWHDTLKLRSLFDPWEGNVYVSIEGKLPCHSLCPEFSLEEELDLPSPVKFLKMEGDSLKMYEFLREKFSEKFD